MSKARVKISGGGISISGISRREIEKIVEKGWWHYRESWGSSRNSIKIFFPLLSGDTANHFIGILGELGIGTPESLLAARLDLSTQ